MKYLQVQLPNEKIESIYGNHYMRFELGGEGNREATTRILQATDRGTEIFRRLFGAMETLIIIKEWENDWLDPNNVNKGHIYDILNQVDFKRMSGPFDEAYYEQEKEGNRHQRILEAEIECDLLIGKATITPSQLNLIIKGLAAYEMGERPAIPQDITFSAITGGTGFRMYDDRGCDIWANSVDILRPIYTSLNDWILDYNRHEIDLMFQGEN